MISTKTAFEHAQVEVEDEEEEEDADDTVADCGPD